MTSGEAAEPCPLCGGRELTLALSYTSPPPGETLFALPAGQYEREYRRCRLCGVYVALLATDVKPLYTEGYVDATYGDGGMARSFERIMSLPPERSDNAQRVRRVGAFWEATRPDRPRTLLDVGSGLGVFPARMEEEGWTCTAVDPDPRAVEHIRRRAAAHAVCGDFTTLGELGRFGLVTFNKVLEHVPDPVAMLRRAHEFLEEGGVVYLEVPDGELAATDPRAREREEFFIEHLFVFSATSLGLLATEAGFVARRIERLREPSDKYTLVAFLEAPGRSSPSTGP